MSNDVVTDSSVKTKSKKNDHRVRKIVSIIYCGIINILKFSA